MPSPPDSIETTLRQWYLARLRKAAHEQLATKDTTPASLIELDRNLIRLLVEPAAKPPQDAQKESARGAGGLLSGWMTGGTATGKSLTERLQSLQHENEALQARLREFEQQELLLSEFCDDVLMVLAQDGTIVCVNHSVTRFWGIPASAAQSRPLSQLIAGSDHERLFCALQNARTNRKSETVDLRIQAGVESQVYSSLTVEWSETKECFFCVGKDISERKMKENIKQEYTAMLTHDLRSPLAALKLTLENLQDGSFGQLAPELEDSLLSAAGAVSRLSTLINKLILLDQSEAGELKLERRMYPVEDLIAEAMSLVKPLAESASVELIARTDDSIVWCDKSAVLQVLTNLLANAIRFSPDCGTVTITENRKLQLLEVLVEDEGPGVRKEMKDAIFQRYKTADQQAKDGQSTGLGLAISKALIIAQGGSIGVRDNSGGGSIFYFTLPVASDEDIG